MKHELCAAFCQELEVSEVPAGIAVGTAFDKGDGDRVGFYIIGPDNSGAYRIQDDGSTVPYIEAAGADLDIPARATAFAALLDEYGAQYDEDTCELLIDSLTLEGIPQAAMRFVALLLRIQDLLLLTRERTESTWVQEAMRDIEQGVAGKARIEFDAPIAPELAAYPADLVLRAMDREPVAVFFGTSDSKVYEALLLQSYARYQVHIDCLVVVLLEKDAALSRKVRLRADNNLIVPRYRGGEKDAIGRIVEAAIGERHFTYSQ